MRGRGITFDTGFIHQGVSTRARFDAAVVRREMQVIRADLHCTAVRLTGGDRDRLETAAALAAAAGLEVWVSPFTCDLTAGEQLDFLADCAGFAERLRRDGAEVVFLTGSELSLFTRGFLPGDTLAERLALLSPPDPRLGELLAQVPARLDDFLGRAVPLVRERFGGRLSYASLPLERVDWARFDLVATDAAYGPADSYRGGVRALAAHGKPVAVTEFGCPTYRGAAADPGHADILEWNGAARPRLNGEYIRDEQEQAAHLGAVIDVLAAEGVDSAFVNTFACYHLPHRADPRGDLDLASHGVVKVLEDRTGPGLPWEPKAAFGTVAERYRALAGGR